jgi:hypothetical protein
VAYRCRALVLLRRPIAASLETSRRRATEMSLVFTKLPEAREVESTQLMCAGLIQA